MLYLRASLQLNCVYTDIFVIRGREKAVNFRENKMSTIRFGTSVGPSRLTGSTQEVRAEVGDKPVDDADPNMMIQCPYDQNHQIRACRFPYHILKCAKNHPKLAKELETCPYNAKHIVPRHELAHHIEHCEDNRSLTTVDDGNTEMRPKFHVPVKCMSLPCEEDWEKEADDNAATFVWGVTNNQLTTYNPAPPVTNHLKAGIRIPQSLPWKSFTLGGSSELD